jgi:hypothetical protein
MPSECACKLPTEPTHQVALVGAINECGKSSAVMESECGTPDEQRKACWCIKMVWTLTSWFGDVSPSIGVLLVLGGNLGKHRLHGGKPTSDSIQRRVSDVVVNSDCEMNTHARCWLTDIQAQITTYYCSHRMVVFQAFFFVNKGLLNFAT